METINIFLASSTTLEKERKSFNDLFIRKDFQDIFHYDNADVQIVGYDGKTARYRGVPSQNELNDELKNSRMSIFLFKARTKEEAIEAIDHAKTGEGTRTEFQIALDLCSDTKRKHVMYVFFLSGSGKYKTKDLDEYIKSEMEEKGIYANVCKNISEVKTLFVVSLVKYTRDLMHEQFESYRRDVEATQENYSLFERLVSEFNDAKNEYDWQTVRKELLRMSITGTIDKVVGFFPSVIKNTTTGSVTDILDNYKNMNRWASENNYNKENHYKLLSHYISLLKQYNQNADTEKIHLDRVRLVDELYKDDSEQKAETYYETGEWYVLIGKDIDTAKNYLLPALRIYQQIRGHEIEIRKIKTLLAGHVWNNVISQGTSRFKASTSDKGISIFD